MQIVLEDRKQFYRNHFETHLPPEIRVRECRYPGGCYKKSFDSDELCIENVLIFYFDCWLIDGQVALFKERECVAEPCAVGAQQWISPMVAAKIAAERTAQDAQWGGPEHDDLHTLLDWGEYIGYQNGALYVEDLHRRDGHDRLVKIAAFAIAALESLERKAGK